MALVTWSSKYSVGVQRMDEQHTVLFEMLNDLHTAMMKGEANKATGALLSKLAQYTHEHFSAEESMMAAVGYQDLANHRIKHRELTKEVDELTARYQRGEASLNLKLLTFLRNWLTNHIQQEDRQYGPWLNGHGVR